MSLQAGMLVMAWVAIGLMALAISGILRQLHVLEDMMRLSPRRHAGGPTATDDLQALHPELNTAFVFVDQGCAQCIHVLERLPALAEAMKDELAFVIVPLRGQVEVNHPLVGTVQDPHMVATQFDVRATPYAVTTRPSGEILSAGFLGSDDALQDFLARSTEKVMHP